LRLEPPQLIAGVLQKNYDRMLSWKPYLVLN